MELGRGSKLRQSGDVVAREIEGELILVPLVHGMGDAENEIFTFNDTGRAIWSRIDGQRTLGDISDELSTEFSASMSEIEAHVLGFSAELCRRGMLVSCP